MLRLSTDRIRVYLHPQRLVMARLSGWPHPKIVNKEALTGWEIESPSDYSETLKVLALQLKRAQWQNARCTAILSGHATHFRAMPWNPALSEEEQKALLRHRYSEIFGKEVNSWKISICDFGYGKQGLACAINNSLLEQIQAIFAMTTAILLDIQPVFMGAFNAYRRRIANSTCWFILLESDLMSAGLLTDKGWMGTRTLPANLFPEQKLDNQLQRWALQFGEDESQASVYLACADQKAPNPSFGSARRVVRLPTPDQKDTSGTHIPKSDAIWAPVQYQS